MIACKWVRLACQRHLNDLKRHKDKGFAWWYDPARAERACKFIEHLPHTKGKWANDGLLLVLESWQRFIVCCLFGWVSKQTGQYRFREAYICVPRKNGKSPLAAAIGLYKFAADKEYGAEVYSGAATEKQAWEVFRPARLMAIQTDALRKAFGIEVNAKTLAIHGNGSRFEPVIGKPGDGAAPSCAIVDEYHEHPDDTLYDTMKTGMVGRENPLLLVITTAGSDQAGPCYQLQIDVQKVLEGHVQNERLFGIIFTIDEGDDWKTENALQKANPNFGISVAADNLKDSQRDAIQTARKQNVFRTKHLNIWVNADVAWIPIERWNSCADKNLKVEEFAGQECDIGLDLASRRDLASKVKVFRRAIDGKMHYFVFATHYLNEEQVQNAAGIHYAGWANEGRLVVTPGDITDYNWISDGLVEDSRKFVVREIPHDPYQAAPLVQFVQAREDWPKNVQFVEFRQTTQLLSPAMKELEGVIFDNTLHHDGDPVLSWMISNVVCHTDKNDNVFPNKQRAENKIDGAVALMMALARSMARPQGDQFRSSVFDRGSFWN